MRLRAHLSIRCGDPPTPRDGGPASCRSNPGDGRPASPFELMAATPRDSTSSSSGSSPNGGGGSPSRSGRGAAPWAEPSSSLNAAAADERGKQASAAENCSSSAAAPASPRAGPGDTPQLKPIFDSGTRISFTSGQRRVKGAGSATAILKGSRAMRMLAASTKAAAAVAVHQQQMPSRAATGSPAQSPRIRAAAEAVAAVGAAAGVSGGKAGSPGAGTSGGSTAAAALKATVPPRTQSPRLEASSPLSSARSGGGGGGSGRGSGGTGPLSRQSAGTSLQRPATPPPPAAATAGTAAARTPVATGSNSNPPPASTAPPVIYRTSSLPGNASSHGQASPVGSAHSLTAAAAGGPRLTLTIGDRAGSGAATVGSSGRASPSSALARAATAGAPAAVASWRQPPAGTGAPTAAGAAPHSSVSRRRPSVPLSLSRLLTMRRASLTQQEGPMSPDDGTAGTGEQECWHEVQASRFMDPVTGADVTMLIQTDVTGRVSAEQELRRVLDAEHKLLEEIFPRQVLEAMTASAMHEGDDCPGSALGGWLATNAMKLALHHEQVTIMFADIVGFTSMAKSQPPDAVMELLNELYTRFDLLLDPHGVFKVETIGDSYMVAGGLVFTDAQGYQSIQSRVDPQHAARTLRFARAMLSAAASVSMPGTGLPVQLRVGVHSGPVVSGVVGVKMPRFCLFGDTVNVASRMESTGQAGAIHVSAATRALVGGDAKCWRPTGGVDVKGKGLMESYFWEEEIKGGAAM